MARRYWLLKTEPECFSIDDLARSPNGTASWDGVRNYMARNYLRDEIKAGDGVLFYHSSTALIGIAGIAEVVRGGYPDVTAQQPDNEHFDPKATADRPIWYTIDIRFKEKFPKVIPLAVLRATAGLERMMVTQRGARLSVQPVSAHEWNIVKRLARRLNR